MNKEDYIIPEEIIFYYPKKLGDCGRIEGFDRLPDILPATVCNKRDTSNKKSTVKYNLSYSSGYRNNYNWYTVKDGEEEVLGEISVKNNSLNVSLIPDEVSGIFLAYCCSEWGTNLGYRTRLFPVIIDSPEILAATNGKRLMVFTQFRDFCQTMLENPYIIDGKFRGTYNLSFTAQFPGLVELRLVDPSNPTYIQAKEKGLTVAKRKTSKWIPGHLYTRGNGSSFLYLGEFQNIILNSCYGAVESAVSLREHNSVLNNCQGHSKFKMGKVFINLFNDSKVNEFRDNYGGMSLIEFIKLNLIDQNNFSDELRCRDSSKSIVTAVDMGEILKYDNNLDINAVLKQMASDQLQVFKKLSDINKDRQFLLSYYPEFIEDNIDEYLDIYLDRMKKEPPRRSYYYGNSLNNTIATVETVRSDLHWKFKDILEKIIINIPDARINNMLAEVANYQNGLKNVKNP